RIRRSSFGTRRKQSRRVVGVKAIRASATGLRKGPIEPAEQSAMKDDSKMADGLGPCLFGESVYNTPAVVYSCLGAAFLVLGVLVCFMPPDPRGPRNAMLIGGLVVASFGAICLVIGLVRLVPNLGASWHLHEHGFRLVRRSGERVLQYKDVDELTLKVVRVFFHGVCTGEVHETTFKSHGSASKVFIKQVRR